MHEILTDITEGRGKAGDLEILEELGWVTAEASLCQLGATAPNPVLSTIRYFRDEYEEHILNKRCPAKVCRKLLHYRVISNLCKRCGACVKVCPSQAISGTKKTKKTEESHLRLTMGNASSVALVSKRANLERSKWNKQWSYYVIRSMSYFSMA